jgi:hypothetical protein
VASWIMTNFTIEYVYRPESQSAGRKRNQIYLYYNPIYTINVYTTEWNPTVTMSLTNTNRVLNNLWVPSDLNKDGAEMDGVAAFPAADLPSLTTQPLSGVLVAGSSALKQDNGDYETLPNYDWDVMKKVRANPDNGIPITALVIRGRDKYWRWAGIKYYEDKKKRLTP